MAFTITPHLNFRGNARQALDFYESVFGGQKTIVTYGDMAGEAAKTMEAELVMWGQVTADSGFRVMAFDMPSARPYDPGESPFFVVLRGDSTSDVEQTWEKLAAQATILQPLGPSKWAPLYGMLKDRFGITWVIDVEVASH